MRRFKSVLALCAVSCVAQVSTAAGADYRERLPEDEIVYFVLPDRFENGDAANDRGGHDNITVAIASLKREDSNPERPVPVTRVGEVRE